MTAPDTHQLYDAVDQAMSIYTQPSRRAAAVHYLQNRGLHAEAIPDHWPLGYAPPGWTRLVDQLRSLGYDDDTLIDAGLARRSSRGSLIDVFRDRLILPAHDGPGQPCGFIGRDLSGGVDAPKYLNSPATAIYDKSQLLYGLFEPRDVAVGQKQPVLVEGPLDVLAITARQDEQDGRALWPMAASGTALTVHQARLLADRTPLAVNHVVVAMDGDRAGRHAALKAGERLRTQGCDVRIAMLPNGADPASYLTEPHHDLTVFRHHSATPLIAAQVERVITDQGDHMQWVEGKVDAARILANYLTTYPPARAIENAGWIASAVDVDRSTFATMLGEAFTQARVLPAVGDRHGDLLREAARAAVHSEITVNRPPIAREAHGRRHALIGRDA
jgi:DNA primase